MPRLLAVVGAVTRPGRLDAAVRFAADCAEALPEVSATVLSLAGHRVSFGGGRGAAREPGLPRLVHGRAQEPAGPDPARGAPCQAGGHRGDGSHVAPLP